MGNEIHGHMSSFVTYELDGHTIDFSYGSSSLDPWIAEYCHKIGLSCWATADVVPFIRIDGEKIYKIRSGNRTLEMRTALRDNVLDSFEEFMFFFSDYFEGYYIPYSEHTKMCDERKKKEEEWERLPKKEKDRIIKEWRETIRTNNLRND